MRLQIWLPLSIFLLIVFAFAAELLNPRSWATFGLTDENPDQIPPFIPPDIGPFHLPHSNYPHLTKEQFQNIQNKYLKEYKNQVRLSYRKLFHRISKNPSSCHGDAAPRSMRRYFWGMFGVVKKNLAFIDNAFFSSNDKSRRNGTGQISLQPRKS